jgi:hypothetical protein
MRFFHRNRYALAHMLIALALFCQGALAIAGCMLPARCPTMAFHAQPCDHGQPDGAMNGNLCLAHATASDQSFDGADTAAIPAMNIGPGLPVPTFVMRVGAQSPIDDDHLVAASPPIPIRYCSLRN